MSTGSSFTACVISWAVGATMNEALVLEALNRALGHRQIDPIIS